MLRNSWTSRLHRATPSLTLPPRGGGLWRGGKSLVLCIFLFLAMSCATKRVEIPTYEGIDPRDALAGRDSVQSMRSTFAIEFERDGGLIQGEGALTLTADGLDLRVYSLGFLVAEVVSDGGVTRSTPALDRNRTALLVEGLRNCFFSWSLRSYEVREEDEAYLAWNSWRKLLINKRTLLPERQTIELEDGRELIITYEEPALFDREWFPSRLRIELARYSVSLTIKTLAIIPR